MRVAVPIPADGPAPARSPRAGALDGQLVDAMVQHARFCAPDEACGLLAVDRAGTPVMAYCLSNVHTSPRHRFTVDPVEHYRAMRHAEGNGWAIGGSFHSHPMGRAVPSSLDIAGAVDPHWWYAVVGPVSRPEVRVFRIVGGVADEVWASGRWPGGEVGPAGWSVAVTLTLDVLGSCGSGPSLVAPASGYLVRSETTAIWLDAGTGTFLELARRIDPTDLAAAVISHMHADHCSDLFGWFHHLAYIRKLDRAIPVLLPPGGRRRIEEFLGQSGPSDPLHQVLDLTEVADGEDVQIGDLLLRFAYADHSVPGIATRIEHNGATLVFSGDTGPGGGFAALAEGADVVLCEAGLSGPRESAIYPLPPLAGGGGGHRRRRRGEHSGAHPCLPGSGAAPRRWGRPRERSRAWCWR